MLLYVLLAGLAVALLATFFRRVTVFEFERGVRYRNGRVAGTLEPGVHWIAPFFTTVTRVDVRPAFVAVPGQEVLTADGVGLKLTVVAKYQVADAERAVNAVASFRDALYTQLQLALREIVGASPVDTVLAARLEIGKQLAGIVAPKATEYGVTLLDAEVKDVMFPGDLKKIFAQVVKARQEGLAALERARGETAALRNLVNAAALLEQRPSLLQLRLLQTVGQGSGNTVVMGVGGPPQTIPLRQQEPPAQPQLPQTDETEA
jgi:regulator of protease activity HflC (stomatin/prohibitin superfamily)